MLCSRKPIVYLPSALIKGRLLRRAWYKTSAGSHISQIIVNWKVTCKHGTLPQLHSTICTMAPKQARLGYVRPSQQTLGCEVRALAAHNTELIRLTESFSATEATALHKRRLNNPNSASAPSLIPTNPPKRRTRKHQVQMMR